jgi:hypothetical protein
MPGVRDGHRGVDRNVRHKLFNVAALLSLLLFMAAVVLWTLSRDRMAVAIDTLSGNALDKNARAVGALEF